jgi:hypothetical protein
MSDNSFAYQNSTLTDNVRKIENFLRNNTLYSVTANVVQTEYKLLEVPHHYVQPFSFFSPLFNVAINVETIIRSVIGLMRMKHMAE